MPMDSSVFKLQFVIHLKKKIELKKIEDYCTSAQNGLQKLVGATHLHNS